MSWQKLSPDEIAWQEKEGRAEKIITATPSLLKQVRLQAGARLSLQGPDSHLLLLTQGSVELGDQGGLSTGDLLWLPGGQPADVQATADSLLYDLALPGGLGGETAEVIASSEVPWELFEDPANRPTQPVQLLMDSNRLAVLRTRFVPEYSAGEHWHDFDTWYFITDGNMRFGHEGIYETGEVRQVTGGYSYGPEEPGSQGVEFVLVSVGGPVALHWADLEPAPHGPLPA